MTDPIDKAKRIVLGTAALAATVRVELDEERGEVDEVRLFGVPVFRRDENTGRPRVFGIPFRRWLRGARK